MISFVLTVLNRADMLSRFFQTMPVLQHPHEWIIVDNASDTATKQLELWIRDTRPNVTLVENFKNEGFGVGNNIGVAQAKYDVIVLTQPDVQFCGDVTLYLQGLYDNVLYGHQLVNFDSGWNKFGDMVVKYATGYFLAFTRKTWESLGGFDPIYYPADYEDVDLSYTAVKKGMSVVSLDVPVSHAHFGSTWAQFSNREETTRRNRQRFAEKWGLT